MAWWRIGLLTHNPIRQVIRVIWHKAASPQQTDGSIVLANTTEFVLPSSHQSPHPNGKSIASAVLHSLWQKVPRPITFYSGRTFPPKLPLPMGGSGHPSNTGFPGPTRVLNPNGISIGSAVFPGFTGVTDPQTDRPRYSVGNNRPHLRM